MLCFAKLLFKPNHGSGVLPGWSVGVLVIFALVKEIFQVEWPSDTVSEEVAVIFLLGWLDMIQNHA